MTAEHNSLVEVRAIHLPFQVPGLFELSTTASRQALPFGLLNIFNPKAIHIL
jgi:hypothetical protein